MTPVARAGGQPGVEHEAENSKIASDPQPRVFTLLPADRRFLNDLVIAGVAVVGIAAYFLLRFAFRTSTVQQNIPLFLILLLGGIPLVFGLIRKNLAREFGSELLAGISVIASAVMGQYLVGAIVILMFSGGTALEELATRRASSVLEALARRMPQTAHRKTGNGMTDIEVGQIAIGDALVVSHCRSHR